MHDLLVSVIVVDDITIFWRHNTLVKIPFPSLSILHSKRRLFLVEFNRPLSKHVMRLWGEGKLSPIMVEVVSLQVTLRKSTILSK